MHTVGNVSDIFRIDNKIALITGAGQGLGRAIAEGFVQYGAAIIIVDIDKNKVEEVVDAIKLDGGEAFGIICDVSDPEQVRSTVNKVISKYQKIDILACIAGIAMRSPAEDMTDEQWNRVISTNLNGLWYFNREVGKRMIEVGNGGRIINMASIAGQIGLTTGNANYSASKGGVIALTRNLAIEWASHGIRVNAIAPVQFKTPLVEKLILQKPETEEYFLKNIPINRIGEVWEIVGAAVFLASKASSMVTRIVLNVDGGHTAR